MATRLGIVNLNGCSYELAYDLLSQSTSENSSKVRLYGILHVTNNYVSWSRGSASVHTSGLQSIGTYYSRGDYTLITRDFTFAHDSNGNFSATISASLSTTFTSGNTSGTLRLPQIKRVSKINSFTGNNIDGTFNVWYTSYISSYTNKLRISIPSVKALQTKDYENGTEFTLDDESKEYIYDYIKNSNSVTLGAVIETWNGNTKLGESSELKNICTLTDANPQFYNFDFEDINSKTLNLTGNSKYNINGYSNIKVTISSENKATPLKKATMSKYRFSVGTSSIDIDYSDTDEVTGTINNSSSGTYNVYAIDSRNNSTLVTKLAEKEIAYSPLTIDKQNCSIVRSDGNVGNEAILTLNGTFWNDTFGKVKNTIKTVTYRLKKTSDSQWIDGKTAINVSATDDGRFSFNGKIASDNSDTYWNLNDSYDIQLTISDELSSSTLSLILNSAIPTISLDKNGVGIMCAYNQELGGLLQVGGNVINKEYVDYYDQYNTKLVKTNKRWYEGADIWKPIYRCVRHIGAINSTNKTIAHNVSDIDKIIHIEGVAITSDGDTYVLPRTSNVNLNQQVQIYVNKTSVNLAVGSNANFADSYVIFEYTRTTD